MKAPPSAFVFVLFFFFCHLQNVSHPLWRCGASSEQKVYLSCVCVCAFFEGDTWFRGRSIGKSASSSCWGNKQKKMPGRVGFESPLWESSEKCLWLCRWTLTGPELLPPFSPFFPEDQIARNGHMTATTKLTIQSNFSLMSLKKTKNKKKTWRPRLCPEGSWWVAAITWPDSKTELGNLQLIHQTPRNMSQ